MEPDKIKTIQFLNTEGELANFPLVIPPEVLIKSYKSMWITRLVDERMITLQRQGVITFAMSSLGEEAAAVGSAAALEIGDWMYPQYREAGIMYYRGFSIENYIHHMFGNEKDLILGRQMPNHFGSRELNVVTVSSPIGTKIPHAAGAAYAMKLDKAKTVVICYFGEGATSEGDFHAGLNFAAVRKVPAIFFCRNNGFAISTPVERQFASDGIAPKGEGYGIPAVRVDGNDFFAVYYATKEAKERGLKGEGPTLIEAMTYRMSAHSTSDDPSAYRQEEASRAWDSKCPILRLRKYLEKQGLWTESKEKELIDLTKEEITLSIEKAKNTPKPSLEHMIENVYNEIPEILKEEMKEIEKVEK